MAKKLFNLLTLPAGIFLFAFVLRVFMLGHIPWGFQWDEASYAYNAYSILKTGKDEWGFRCLFFWKPLEILSQLY